MSTISTDPTAMTLTATAGPSSGRHAGHEFHYATTLRAEGPPLFHAVDAEGKALQLMRSWFTGMPGEVLSCVGCHESQSSTPPAKSDLSSESSAAPLCRSGCSGGSTPSSLQSTSLQWSSPALVDLG